MNIFPFFSYKSFYYYTKDIKTIDLSKYQDVTDEDDDREEFTEDYFWGLFESDSKGLSKGEMTIIYTSKGAFIYHHINDRDYVRDFLKKNSKKSPLGVFGSFRTVDMYLIGVASNGNIDRLVFSDERGDIVEGKGSDFEKYIGSDFCVDKNGGLNILLDESKVCEYARAFMGFDLEKEDLEILDVRFYERDIEDATKSVLDNPNARSSKVSPINDMVDFSSTLIPNARDKVSRNLYKCGVVEIAIFVSYNKELGETIISCSHYPDGITTIPIYCESYKGFIEKDKFMPVMCRCIDAIARLDLNTPQNTITNPNDFSYNNGNRKSNTALICIDTERKFMFSVCLTQKKGKKINSSIFNMWRYGLIMYDITQFEMDRLYYHLIRILK